MKTQHVTNTSDRAKENPLLGLMDALNIPAAEKRGQTELINSSQLPSKWNGHNNPRSLKEQYELMGIKVVGETKGDNLFLDVILPEGWKKEYTSHSMWNKLVDNKGRTRATFFYKAAFYDREAFINFNTRYGLNVITYLPSEEKGHYEMQDVKRPNPNYNPPEGEENANEEGYEIIYGHDGYSRSYYRHHYRREPKYITAPEQVWIPKFKDSYAEYNATPHYYELTDGDTVFFTSKEDPIFFKRKYRKDRHEKWWKDYQHISDRMRTIAHNTLTEKYPEWKDINAYWD